MISKYRVLSFGLDPVLLKTRRLLMERRFESIAISSLLELEKLPLNPAFDLVILCHTLSEHDRLQAAVIAREKWPAVKLLALGFKESVSESLAFDEVTSAIDGPRALLEKAEAMITAI